jgi:hypothetical protein
MPEKKLTSSKDTPPASPPKHSPSKFMRNLRPEYYSDTEDRTAYVLDAPTLEYHLDTITQRNQTHDFEIFCRKLCEKTICPNLRPPTGPEGGGDSKADAETFPVADEIATLNYVVGEANSGRERWAFAFSAKKEWTKKVQSDVKGIIETKRQYTRIICVTSRFARAKDRSRIEDGLSKKYGVPVTIHDRTWIVKEIIENERKDIAFNYLKIGEEKTDPNRIGPKDYSRAQELAEIEKSIDDPEAFRGMERQRITESLIAAKLARNIEKPRTEVDGRFLRAIRFADADGTDRQKIEARYEHIWTSFWWYDDFHFVNTSYDTFENMVIESDYIKNLELLRNLLQLLFNAVIHNHMSREECLLDRRVATLKKALKKLASDKRRPNGSLEARTSLLIIRLSEISADKDLASLPEIWRGFSDVLNKAAGLGEFDADELVRMVEVAGLIENKSPEYKNLIEKTAEFVAKRKGEAEGALVLLKQAQKLDFENKFDMIRFLGKATIGLAKKEYTDSLIEALQLLMLAYRSAGLLWAARATCIFLAASLVMQSEEESHIPVVFIPVMKVLAWIARELRHLPDFLYAIQLLNGALATLPLTEESQARLKDDMSELDMGLTSLFVKLDEADLGKLENVPDILEALGLFGARTALLYILGHIDVLRADGSFPPSESDEEVNRVLSMVASQPISQQLRGSLILNYGKQIISTKILGMTVEVVLSGSTQSILIGEAILSSLEAFFATTIEQRIIPHLENLRLTLVENDKASKPVIDLKPSEAAGTVLWPTKYSPTSFAKQKDIQLFLMELSGHVLSATCVMDDAKKTLKKLYVDEAVQHRMAMLVAAANSYHRLAARNVSNLSDWKNVVKQSFSLKKKRPTLQNIKLEHEVPTQNKSNVATPPKLEDHRKLSVRSVIDIHAWDQAQWTGTAYVSAPMQPPGMALAFRNETAARKIFQRWKERFGDEDKNEEISISIVRELPGLNKYHYTVVITSSLPKSSDVGNGQVFAMTTRCNLMEPSDDINLGRFLKSYAEIGAYYLLPAILDNSNQPRLIPQLAILKRKLTIKLAANVSRNDTEFAAFLQLEKERL